MWYLCYSSLTIGFVLYVVYRNENLYLFKWLNELGAEDIISKMRNINLYALPKWIYNSLPYGLWNFSLGTALIAVWNKKLTITVKLFIVSVVFISGVFIEILQGFKIIRGTFDRVDLVVLISSFVCIIIILNNKNKKNEKSIY